MVTAILLLLSLPVLAGEVLFIYVIAPALNRAVCWKLFTHKNQEGKDKQQVTQQNFKSMRNLNDCAPEPITNFAQIDDHTLGSYLAGLIEGDGTIVVPRQERNAQGKLNYASIQVAFAAKDFPLVTLLAKKLGYGSINKRKEQAAYIYTVNSFPGLVNLVNLVNGFIRTPKIEDLKLLIEYLKQKDSNCNIECKPINNSQVSSDA